MTGRRFLPLAIGNTIAFATGKSCSIISLLSASFGGEEIGILQSLREVLGFLAFTAILVMLIVVAKLRHPVLLLLGQVLRLQHSIQRPYGFISAQLLCQLAFTISKRSTIH